MPLSYPAWTLFAPPPCSQMFSEMKGYANPNHAIKRTVVALLVYLDIFPSEIEMGPDLPKQVDTNEELWTLARKAVQLYPHHPEYESHT